MFNENPEYTDAVDRLFSAFRSTQRGVTLTWHEIERVMGRHRNDKGGRRIVTKWRRRMERECAVVMHANSGVGLDVLRHSDTVRKRATWRTSRARRQVHWGLREMKTVEVKSLSDHDRRALAFRNASFRDQRRQLLRDERQAEREGSSASGVHDQRLRARDESL